MPDYSFYIALSYGAVSLGLSVLAILSFGRRKKLQSTLDALKEANEPNKRAGEIK